MAARFADQSIEQLTRHIRHVAKSTELVFITMHAKARMRQRRVLDAEVYHCLQKGKILIPPEEDVKTGNLVCRVECYGASKNIAVCAALDDDDPSIVVVTVLA